MEEFLEEFGDYYGYPDGPKNIKEIRENSRDWKKMENIFKDFTSNVYGNPHSQSDISSATSDLIADARHQVLEYFNASPEDYSCIFTSGSTAALKLGGETFPWTHDSNFLYTMENHNSVPGIREYALGQGAVDIEEAANQPGQFASLGSSIKEMPIIYVLSLQSVILLA